MNDLSRITLRLAEFEVEAVIVGGLGILLQGAALMTRDVDVACRMESDNLIKLHRALENLSPVHRMSPERPPFTWDQAQLGGWKNLYLSTAWGQLDCLGEVRGIGGYSECLASSEPIELDGRVLRVLTLEALIAAKRAMGRPRDLHAVLELEAIREKRGRSA